MPCINGDVKNESARLARDLPSTAAAYQEQAYVDRGQKTDFSRFTIDATSDDKQATKSSIESDKGSGTTMTDFRNHAEPPPYFF